MTTSAIQVYLLDKAGGGRKIDIGSVAGIPSHDEQLLWIHLDYSQSEAVAWLEKCVWLDPLAVESLLEEASRPRAALFQQGLLVDLRGVNLNPGADPEDMVGLRLWLDEHCILSSNRRRLLSLDDIRSSLGQGRGPRSSAEFLAELVDRMVERTADAVERVEDDLDDLEDRLLSDEYGTLRTEIAGLRRQAIQFRRFIFPQKEGLLHLQKEPPIWLQKPQRLHLRESANRLNRVLEDLDSVRDRANVAQEELISRLSELMNQRMYGLTLVATLFMPLGFLTGLLGINVGGIPGAQSPLGFLFVCLLIAGLAICQVFYLKKKRWL